jgi:hypothetical protein
LRVLWSDGIGYGSIEPWRVSLGEELRCRYCQTPAL